MTFYPVSVKYDSVMFGKKKKNKEASDTPSDSAAGKETKESKKGKGKGATEELPQPESNAKGSGKKKKFFTIKKMIFILMLLAAVAIAGFVVYRIYFKKADTATAGYAQQELVNITLPEEILRFSYDFMPAIYDSLRTFNSEVILLENEIERIKAIAEQYPDQKKIAEKEIKIWEKEKDKMKKAYEKIETKVEALYVSYRVNQDAGLQLVDEQKAEIAQSAQDALTGSLALTERLKTVAPEVIPEGFVKGNIYKIKKKITELTN
ncbi:hypothetical protein [Desulfamplus magnetovallimortis]|uniref:hypothetical protein n=1 Tax=Desulfamplus magnetovallimortis TaxID=1246637 RepID=UPI00111A143A|nr:hypothetical protein [Desulfamplus magnetovallimortis]